MFSKAEVERALRSDEFVLHYQPIVDLETGQPRGVEALIRWQHPVGGLLAPDDFLPAIAHTPVISGLTRWVIYQACAQAARWPYWTMSVNITARDVASRNFADDVAAAVADARIPGGRLVLELTETALVQDLPRAAGILGHLREHGVSVALDDFGTGYSSILYLRELPVNIIKIDRRFIAGILANVDDRAIVASLLTLSRNVRLMSIAEGVESPEQARLLSSLGCQHGQGYLWSRPLPAIEIEPLHENGLPASIGRGTGRKPSNAKPTDEHLLHRAHELLAQGASLHTIAAALNAAGERTDTGARWHANTVARLIAGKDAMRTP